MKSDYGKKIYTGNSVVEKGYLILDRQTVHHLTFLQERVYSRKLLSFERRRKFYQKHDSGQELYRQDPAREMEQILGQVPTGSARDLAGLEKSLQQTLAFHPGGPAGLSPVRQRPAKVAG